MFSFLLSGGLAGLAGICEAMSTVGQLQPTISPGYGFAAIIVAFLGRLNPIGVLFAGLLLAISYLGGEAAQVSLGVSDKIARVFQGMLLFFILACDTLILYRFRLIASRRHGWPMGQLEAIILIIITASTPLLLAALGELVAERSGVLNLGVEGMMVMGAVCGFGAAFLTGSPVLGILAAILSGAALAALFGRPHPEPRSPTRWRPGLRSRCWAWVFRVSSANASSASPASGSTSSPSRS